MAILGALVLLGAQPVHAGKCWWINEVCYDSIPGAVLGAVDQGVSQAEWIAGQQAADAQRAAASLEATAGDLAGETGAGLAQAMRLPSVEPPAVEVQPVDGSPAWTLVESAHATETLSVDLPALGSVVPSIPELGVAFPASSATGQQGADVALRTDRIGGDLGSVGATVDAAGGGAAPGAVTSDAGAAIDLRGNALPAAAQESSTIPLSGIDRAIIAVALMAAGALTLLPCLALYRRLVPSSALRQPTRRATYEMVVSRPGLTAFGIARALGFDRHTAGHHLRVLQEFGLVEVRTIGGRARFFAPGIAGQDRDIHARLALQHPTAQRVVAALAAGVPPSASAIARQTGLARTTVLWHLDRLTELGLLDATGRLVPLAEALVEYDPRRTAAALRSGLPRPVSPPIV